MNDTVNDTAYIALGSNVGDREEHLATARRRIAAIPGVMLVAESTVEETAPIGLVAQRSFLNQMVSVRTALSPGALLSHLQRIEQEGGRVREVRWGPRTIDLDIVKFGSATCSDELLSVPHPELANRPFWQRELIELHARGGENE
ncbi:MAG: 2-amino-4-hydroxy-6-hydroxymethyldihydropteridine diphosphokinase [Gemmatimonadaceae bacterium]